MAGIAKANPSAWDDAGPAICSVSQVAGRWVGRSRVETFLEAGTIFWCGSVVAPGAAGGPEKRPELQPSRSSSSAGRQKRKRAGLLKGLLDAADGKISAMIALQ